MLFKISQYFEMAQSGETRWLPMEGMRGIAVTLVFFVHYSSGMEVKFGARPGYLDAIHAIGNAGVDIFFVLSGFLIYRAVIRRQINYWKYASRRVERIYPTFIFILCVYLGLSIMIPAKSKLPEFGVASYVVANALLLPGMFDIIPIISVAWSLSYEAFYYIMVPVLVAAIALRRWTPLYRICLFSVFLLAYVLWAWSGYALHFRLTMFLGGILLYEVSCVWREARESPVIDGLALLLFVAALGLFAVASGLANYVFLNFTLVLLLYRCLFASGPAARLFTFRPMRWLGNMSYSYYLTHSLGLHAFFLVLSFLEIGNSFVTYTTLIPVAFAFSVMSSIPVYLLVERPLSLKPAPV